MVRRPSLLALAAAAVSGWAMPATAQAIEREYAGPMRFCSAGAFSVDLAEGEKATVSDPRIDFLVTYFDLATASLGIYEGNHPQDDGKRQRLRWFKDVVLYRLTEGEEVGYLVRLNPDDDFPYYLHIFSNAFTGSGADRQILPRVQLGDSAKAGCDRSTYEPGDAAS